jgi:hypothetical protein
MNVNILSLNTHGIKGNLTYIENLIKKKKFYFNSSMVD